MGRRGGRADRLDAYVNGLSQAERDRIALYLNFDMVGSPNYVFMVLTTATTSGFPAPPGVPIPPGSVQIEDLFESYFTLAGQPYDDAQFSGRSDYQRFIQVGIPAGGLFTGAEVVKTPAQQAIWGGTAGRQFDPCYHLACDTFANNSNTALGVNSDAIAFAVLTYAYSTATVNGVPGQPVPGNFTIPAPAGPEGTGGRRVPSRRAVLASRSRRSTREGPSVDAPAAPVPRLHTGMCIARAEVHPDGGSAGAPEATSESRRLPGRSGGSGTGGRVRRGELSGILASLARADSPVRGV